MTQRPLAIDVAAAVAIAAVVLIVEPGVAIAAILALLLLLICTASLLLDRRRAQRAPRTRLRRRGAGAPDHAVVEAAGAGRPGLSAEPDAWCGCVARAAS